VPLAWCLIVAAGCSGGGVVHTLPLRRTDFQPGERPITSVPITQAYYWTDEDGTLNIGLGYRARSLLGKAYDAEWFLSLVLDGLPAGSERLYKLGKREIRTVQSHGGDHRRGSSGDGVAVIEAPRGGRLKGRFQAWIRQQRFSVLAGWSSRAPALIMAGEFEAVLNPVKGRQILARTEEDGFGRPPADGPTTRPASGAPVRPVRRLDTAPAGAPAAR